MKKSTKSAKPDAPQVKSVNPRPVEPKPVKKTVAPRKKATVKQVATAPSAPARANVQLAPASGSVKPSRAATKITARIDIGFGNTLFIRGEGPGLSWDRGVIMDCVADDVWSISLPPTESNLIFKFLVNDLTWSVGSDYVIASGTSIDVVPAF